MKNYIYPYRQKDFDTFQQTYFKSDKKLSVTECDNAVIVPHEFKFENNQQSTHLGGVIDKNNKYIPESAWYRWITPSDRDTFETSDTYQNADFIDETVVYGGYFYNHWGHFLIEMVGRLWYYIENSCSDRNIKIALAVKNEFRLHDNFKEFFDMLGISESDIIYVDNPTRFKKVIVPENSTIITKYYTDKYILPFKILYNSVKPNNIDKVYFSRRNWQKNGAAIGESRIEKSFRDNGFQIFAPEKMRLAKMISILKGAKHIAGLVGTLTHNFIFANPKANIILLNREEYMNPSQEMIRKCLHQNASYIDVFMNILPVRPGTGPYIVGATSCFIDFCKSNHINQPKLQNQPTAKQITEFLTNWAQNYDDKRNDTFMMNKKVSDWMNLVINLYKKYPKPPKT